MLLLCLCALCFLGAWQLINGASPGCSQASFDGFVPKKPAGATTFQPNMPMRPFYQWLANQGYCGEVSLINVGLGYGQWISQFNARCLATTFGIKVTQTGTTNGKPAIYESQLLLDDGYITPNTKYGNSFGRAASNFLLIGKAYDSAHQPPGLAGYRQFMTWIKSEMMKGHRVVFGVVELNHTEAYSHIVNAARVDITDIKNPFAYSGTDVLYVEEHGVYTCSDAEYPCTGTDNPAIPPGSGNTPGCTPFTYGYTFDNWHRPLTEQVLMLPVPTGDIKNYGYSISGIADTQNVTLPIYLTIKTALPWHPVAGNNYEVPFITGTNDDDNPSNVPPTAMHINLTATVSALKPGSTYNLYRYHWTARPLPRGPLKVPTANFNLNAKMATTKTTFKATGTSFVTSLSILSSDTVVFRCVPTTAL